MSRPGIGADFFFEEEIAQPGDLFAQMVEAAAACPLVVPESFAALDVDPYFNFMGMHGIEIFVCRSAQEVLADVRRYDIQEIIQRLCSREYGPENRPPQDYYDRVRALTPAHLQWGVEFFYHPDPGPPYQPDRAIQASLGVSGELWWGSSGRKRFLGSQFAADGGFWQRDNLLKPSDEDCISWEEKLGAFTTVVHTLVERVQPYMMKVFLDGELELPVNAYMAYYRSLQSVVDDLRWFKRYWEHGLERGPGRRRVAPLKEEGDMWTRWGQGDLWHTLEQLMPYVDLVTPEAVQAVMAAGRQHWYHLAQGHTVLHHPNFTHELLDDFYCDVIRTAMRLHGAGVDFGTCT